MDLIWLYVIIGVVFLVQIGLFFVGRRIRKRERENDVLLKYDIKSRKEAWDLMADPDIPDEDRKRIEAIYNQE